MRVLLLGTDGSATADRLVQASELTNRRINVETVHSVVEGIILAADKRFGAIVIDVPNGHASDVVRKIREDIGTPIIVVRKRHSPAEAIEFLESGADDVVADPIDMDELVARLRSLARRCAAGVRDHHRIDDLELFPKEQIVQRGGQRLSLTSREFALLEYMMEHRDRVLSRSELADQVWGAEVEWNSNVIDVSIGRLRAKIQPEGTRPLIHTVTGRGYMISDTPPLIG